MIRLLTMLGIGCLFAAIALQVAGDARSFAGGEVKRARLVEIADPRGPQ